MARDLHSLAAMRRLILILLILLTAHRTLQAQTRTIESAEISGVDEGSISEDVRNAVNQLAGKPLDENATYEIVVRIQAEDPAFTAKVQISDGSKPDFVKVVFLVEKSTAPLGTANINSRYTVERVDVHGYDESRLSRFLRDEIQSLVGQKLNQDDAGRVLDEIKRELQPRYTAARRVTKGSDPQHIVIIYEIEKARIIPFIDIPADGIVYHSKQGFSLNPSVDFGKIQRVYFGGSNDQDLLLERFYGWFGGFESSRIGTDHLGVALRYGRFREHWQSETILADPNSIYRERNTFDPSITFGFDPRFRIVAGLGITELQMQNPVIHNQNSNAVTASAILHNVWANATEEHHVLDASYDFRAGNHELDSDFIYTRHFARAEYTYSHNKDHLTLSFEAGTISGNAPLYERFSLGNTTTLRGWNKFDITPAGGDRMVHATVQYGFGKPEFWKSINIDNNGVHHSGHFGLGFHIFYDVGAVGNSGSPIPTKHSAGLGIGRHTFFMELGFPINSSSAAPLFMMGFRF
jgi:hypothetical protein